jgi:hypothetical protein
MPSNIDKLTASLKNVGILSDQEIESLKNTQIPTPEEIESFAQEPEVSAILDHFSDQPNEQMIELHKLAKEFVEDNQLSNAWKVILQD